jgi:hypothetical protein
VSGAALTWYLVAFGLLLASGAMIGVAAINFLASLTPLYVAIGLAVGAIVCAMVGLARQVGDGR